MEWWKPPKYEPRPTPVRGGVGDLVSGTPVFAITLNFVQLANGRPDLAAPLNALTRAMW